MFSFAGKRWFVWSGWSGDTNVEQNLYIARMSDPVTPTGKRYIISQPRESWERVVGNPYINEAPAVIKDPNGQLQVTYSANGSWSEQYCIGDLRLRSGGVPTYVWDWYKSNGCLFGSDRATMMSDWMPAVHLNGPGSHSFVLLDGDSATSPPAGKKFPLMFHGVPEGTPYKWSNRYWYADEILRLRADQGPMSRTEALIIFACCQYAYPPSHGADASYVVFTDAGERPSR